MTNYHRLSNYFEPGKSKVRVLVDLVSGKSPLPRFQSAMFLLYPHMREECAGGRRGSCPLSSYEATNFIHPYDLTGT